MCVVWGGGIICRRTVPFVTVVTDLGGAHPTWFHKDVDICFVPSDPVRLLALNCGLKNYQVGYEGRLTYCMD